MHFETVGAWYTGFRIGTGGIFWENTGQSGLYPCITMAFVFFFSLREHFLSRMV